MKPSKRAMVSQQAALQALRALSRKLPGAEEYVMVHHPAFRVGKKPFAIAGMDEGEVGATVSINLGPEAQSALLGDERFWKTPYIGQHGWVTVRFQALSDGELRELVVDSFRRVAGKKQLAALAAAAPGASSVRKAAKVSAKKSGKRAD